MSPLTPPLPTAWIMAAVASATVATRPGRSSQLPCTYCNFPSCCCMKGSFQARLVSAYCSHSTTCFTILTRRVSWVSLRLRFCHDAKSGVCSCKVPKTRVAKLPDIRQTRRATFAGLGWPLLRSTGVSDFAGSAGSADSPASAAPSSSAATLCALLACATRSTSATGDCRWFSSTLSFWESCCCRSVSSAPLWPDILLPLALGQC
mmetsp:Transcript_109554/g.205458  ORF Transcript_109554/g.205458 Transcript_109554/m.205458 type:complete len:205 (+) Transcript_109554:217-831(+)